MAVALAAHRDGEDVHFDRLLAAVGLRGRARADVVAFLDVGEARLVDGGDRRVVGELERDGAAVTASMNSSMPALPPTSLVT